MNLTSRYSNVSEKSHKRRWRIAAASAAGSSHVRDGIPNQDAVDCRLVEIGGGQVVVAAVADGAGSAPRSEEGSQIAVKTAVASIVDGVNKRPAAAFRKHLATSLVRGAIKRAKNAVVRYGKTHRVPAKELACTLIVAVASERLVTAAQVGDGAVIVFDTESGASQTLCAAHSGEYANETIFITSRTRPHLVASVGHASGYDYDALGLITDGLQNLALRMPEREAFPGFWTPMLKDLAQTGNPESVPGRLHTFISNERVQSRTSDDVTIAIACQDSREPKEAQQ